MNCKKCGKEVSEDSKFCNHCGLNFETKQTISKRKFIIPASALVSILIVGLIIFLVLNNSLSKFKRYVENGDVLAAATVYSEKITEKEDKEKATSFLKSQISSIEKQYVDEKIKYEDANTQLNSLKEFSFIDKERRETLKFIKGLHNSRKAFELGEEYTNDSKFERAISELEDVIKEDNNYEKAKNLIIQNKNSLKEQKVNEAAAFAKNKDFAKAISALHTVLDYFPDDTNIITQFEGYKDSQIKLLTDEAANYAKNNNYEKAINIIEDALQYLSNDELKSLKKQYETNQIELLKESQEVSVTKTSIESTWLYDGLAVVVVKNNTKKTVKNYAVSILSYDKNGYPIKAGFLNDDYEIIGKSDKNIQPGEQKGWNSGWDLDSEDVKKILAVVYEVEYYDGSTWRNPYYDYWKKEHYEQPLN